MIACANDTANGKVYNYYQSGAFTTAHPYATLTNPYGLVIGDFNGDGYNDYVIACHRQTGLSSNIEFHLNVSGAFDKTDGFSIPNTRYVDFICATDFNDDGKLDLAVADSSWGNITVLKNNGWVDVDSDFTIYNQLMVTRPWAPAFAQLDGSGPMELLVTARGTNQVLTYTYSGASLTGYTTWRSFTPLSSVSLATTMDINGDGSEDILATSTTNNMVYVYLTPATEDIWWPTGSSLHSTVR